MEFIQDMFNDNGPQTTFLLIGVGGLILLVISLILDGIFDALSFGDGPLSLTTLSAFFGIFGFSALICYEAFGFSTAASAGAGSVPALIGGLGAWGLTRFLKKGEHSDTVSTASLVGVTAAVTLSIPNAKKGGYGEISVRHNDNVYNFSATADEDIPKGKQVKVDTVLSNTLVSVSLLRKIDPDVEVASDGIPELPDAATDKN